MDAAVPTSHPDMRMGVSSEATQQTPHLSEARERSLAGPDGWGRKGGVGERDQLHDWIKIIGFYP